MPMQAAVPVSITPFEAVLTAADDKATIRPGVIVGIDVLANDHHLKDAALRVVEVGGIDGMKIWVEDGLVRVYASEGMEGTFETSYLVESEDGFQAKAVLYVTVDPKAEAPVTAAVDDEITVRAGEIVRVDLLANDTFANGKNTGVAKIEQIDGIKLWIENGEAFAYVPEGHTTPITFAYAIVDSEGVASEAKATLTIEGAAVTAAVDDDITVRAGEVVRLDLLANDTFANGKNTGVAKIEQIDGIKLWIENGEVYAYVPEGHTSPITFAYVIVDSEGVASEAKATLTVQGPVTTAADDAITLRAGEVVQLDLLTNDVFANGKITGVSSVQEVDGIKLWIENGQVYAYVPEGHTAPITFTYTITDSEGVSAEARAVLTIDTSTKDMFGTQFGDVLSSSSSAGEGIWALGGRDDVVAGNGNDTIYAGNGHDTVDAGLGDDLIYGGTGSDGLAGGEGNDTAYGDAGADTLDGGLGGDSLLGGTGRDRLLGGEGDDALFGGSGNDVLWAGEGDDSLDGGIGADSLSGDVGNDALWGGAGGDTLDGGEGDDRIVGGRGSDVLTGGAGADTFVWEAWNDSGKGRGVDRVVDFQSGEDTLDMSALFTDVEAVWVGDAAFSKTAGEVRYDIDTGMLWLDRDGNGVRDMGVAFEPGTALVQEDFLF